VYKRAAEQGNGEAACHIGAMLAATGDHEAAARWFTRAVELGFAPARAALGEVLWRRLGDRARGEQMLRAAVSEADPTAIEVLAFMQQQAGDISADEWGARMGEAARLRLAAELGGQSWAQVKDLSALTDEEIHRWDDDFKRWCAKDDALMARFNEKGEDELPDPLRDGDMLRVRNEYNLEWVKRRRADAERRGQLSAAAVAEAEEAKWAWETENADELSALASVSQRPNRDLDITGCRLVAGADNTNGAIAGVSIRFAVGKPVAVFLRGRPWATMEWDKLDWIGVEPLPERSRVTVPRAAAFGLFSLGAKKRRPWCAITIIWGARHLVFEVPVEAHRPRGEMATAGLPVDGAEGGWSPSGLGRD
jgi:hypothetical protein